MAEPTARRVLIALVLFVAGCGEPSNVDDGGVMDASTSGDGGGVDGGGGEGTDGGPDRRDGATSTCGELGDECARGCCPGLVCGTNAAGAPACVVPGCVPDDGACVIDADCCSLSCEAGSCGAGARCTSIDGACSEDADCCSANCDGSVCGRSVGGCGTIGEACTSGSDCCGDHCVDETGAQCDGGDCRCAVAGDCRADDEICTSDTQCCIGVCDRPGGATVGSCAAIGSCSVAGEPCGSEGFSGSCCSTICLDPRDTGTATCQRVGGCRVEDEVCTNGAQCCSGLCEETATSEDGRPILRCARAGSCLAPGEVCGDDGASSSCCPSGGGDTGCEPAAEGVRRCVGGTDSCVLPGAACTATSDCCVETFPTIMCAPGPAGSNVCCLADGEECSFGGVCCGGICAPGADGVLRCGTSCVADGGGCTTDADCCGCGCVAGACTSAPEQCSPCADAQLGESCSDTVPCCNPDVVECSTGVEFRTCQLRR